MRLLVILYAGDYRHAYKRMAANEGETYHGHQYAIQSLIKISQEVDEVAVLCCQSQEAYDENLESNFRVIGTGFSPEKNMNRLLRIISDYCPTHVVLRTPMLGILGFLTKRKIPTLIMFADSFLSNTFSAKLRCFWMVRQLNQPCVQWVSNHGLNACHALQLIGVKNEKIIPWDWPHTLTPSALQPKTLKTNGKPWRLMYVGSISETKGVGDLIEAIAHLKRRQFDIKLEVAGKGETEKFSLQAKRLGVDVAVEFLGLIPNNTVVERMRKADLVLVPSRHEYPEGFPLTIYEGLCARTPIIASDHPMFAGILSHETSAMVFPAGDPIAITDCVEQVLTDADLYHKLSIASLDAWKRLQIPVKWADLIERWLFKSKENSQWLQEHRLSSGRYSQSTHQKQLA